MIDNPAPKPEPLRIFPRSRTVSKKTRRRLQESRRLNPPKMAEIPRFGDQPTVVVDYFEKYKADLRERLGRSERRKMLRKVSEQDRQRLMRVTVPTPIDIDQEVHAMCGYPMGAHPKPDYAPCPITVIDGVGVTVG